MSKIVVIDYGLGNIRSVRGALIQCGREASISGDINEMRAADALVLPGVGAFGDGMSQLRARNLVEPLTDLVMNEKKPILGICLGAQLMAHTGSEFGDHEGLGWIEADVRRIDADNLPLPHVGWNDIELTNPSLLYKGMDHTPLVYFVHTYHIDCREESLVTSRSHYGHDLVASYEIENIYGTQFHPEKSQADGLKSLENFLNLI